MMRPLFLIGAAVALGLASPQANASNCAVDMYDHNGSLMEVQLCDNYLGITYVRPRAGLPSSVVNGTLLFEGRISGIGAVSGQSRLFSATCGELTYDVEGAVRPNSILLSGTAPVRDANCRVTRYRNDELLFTLQAAAAPQPLAPRPAARPPPATLPPRAAAPPPPRIGPPRVGAPPVAGPPRIGPPRTATAAPAACGWYAVGGCFQSESDANRRSIQIDAYTLDTYNVSNFTDGWYCSVDGPYGSQADADVVRLEFRGMGIDDAYVKKGGC